MKKCKWYEFHSWKNIFQPYESIFMGENCIKEYVSYKKCTKCGTIKSDGYERPGILDLCEVNVLNKKLEDKGTYFNLPLRKMPKTPKIKPPKQE